MTSPSDNEPAPKIIVDSDWKEQVAKEKEQLADTAEDAGTDSSAESKAEESNVAESTGTEASASEQPADEVAADESASTPAKDQPGSGPKLPPASFEVLISMLFTQAISALGQMPSPDGSQTKVDKPMAKHTIDTLEMLEVKTKGNLSADESKMLNEALHALRMTYVGVRG